MDERRKAFKSSLAWDSIAKASITLSTSEFVDGLSPFGSSLITLSTTDRSGTMAFTTIFCGFCTSRSLFLVPDGRVRQISLLTFGTRSSSQFSGRKCFSIRDSCFLVLFGLFLTFQYRAHYIGKLFVHWWTRLVRIIILFGQSRNDR